MRGLAAFAAGVVLSAQPAFAAQAYVDQKFGYSASFPDGWIVGTEAGNPGAVVGIGGEGTPDLRICLVTVTQGGPQSKLTQAQINQDMRAPFGESVWREMVGKSLKNVKIESNGTREHPSTLVAQEVLLSYSLSETDARPMRMSLAVMLTPQAAYSVGCNTQTAVFEKFKSELKAFVDSFRHAPGVEASVNPAPSPAPVVEVSAVGDMKSLIAPIVAETAASLKSKAK